VPVAGEHTSVLGQSRSEAHGLPDFVAGA